MSDRERLLRPVLFANGMVDLLCAAILLILPLLHRPLLGYQVFDAQGAFMAGGWGIATLALGVTRLWSSSRPAAHPAVLRMGLFEGTTLALYSLLNLSYARVSLLQALLPLTVGSVFGLLYLLCALRR
jgi:hypothetical protein